MTVFSKCGVSVLLALVGPVGSVSAQTLTVAVAGNEHKQWEAITVTVKNESGEEIVLAYPLFTDSKRSLELQNAKLQVASSVPLEIERRGEGGWVTVGPPHQSRRPTGRDKLKPGDNVDFRFGVVGPGEYRVRVFYFLDHGDLGPPKRAPRVASVVSASFVVTPNEVRLPD